MRKIPSYTLQLREHFTSLFDSLEIESYYFTAHDRAGFEYITFELREIDSCLDAPNGRRLMLEINLWNKRNQESIEALADRLTMLLQNYAASVGGGFAQTYPAYDRLNIDEGKDIRRIRINFDVRYYTC